MNESHGHQNILNLKLLKYGGGFLLPSPPENSSEKVSVELELLENIGKNVKEEDKENVERYRNIEEVYGKILSNFSLNYDANMMKCLLEDIEKIVSFEKARHQRPRPITLGNSSRMGFEINESVKSNSPFSYPSLRVTQSKFLSLYLAESFPLYKEVFEKTSNDIAMSVLTSCNNYPTDNLAGQTLAHILYNNHKEDLQK